MVVVARRGRAAAVIEAVGKRDLDRGHPTVNVPAGVTTVKAPVVIVTEVAAAMVDTGAVTVTVGATAPPAATG